eukprot:CAMPEP_0184651996 /NCGR_PEP_ID=MMETSP0308-20130426/9661_1 /TAXON_ID=38269 /ORGANISM="Gloeochaete witrockiana, Strain SAG 46.84" /LENGTH=136 /DNA_ID=CAMNT_0027086593 /DNA_START=1317 /DNA_END=1731 /DNA_ORIENTATION=-
MSQGAAEPEVTRVDQANINRFNRLNQQLHEFEDELKANKDELVNLEDASNDLMLVDDDDTVKQLIGEAFIEMNAKTSQDLVEKCKEDVQKQADRLSDQISDIKSKMQELKTVLYGKFGSAINLEEEPASSTTPFAS